MRSKLVLAVAFAALSAWSQAMADVYPDRPIKFLVPFNAGGSYDVVARALGQKLAEYLGQPVVIENRPGSGGVIGTEAGARAAPDGYTIIMFGNNQAILPSMYPDAKVNVRKDFAPVSLVASVSGVLLVNPELPAKTVAELITLAQSQPGKLNYGSGGSGSSTHLGMERFKLAAAVDILHIPYKAGVPATMDLIAGRTQVGLLNIASARPFVEAGKLRALAITGKERSKYLPGIVTIDEAGVHGFEFEEWCAVVVPAGTPASIIEKLQSAIARAVNDPTFANGLTSQALIPAAMTPSQLTVFLDDEIAKYAKAVKASGTKVD
jgi:tripartite-type tricarboxylate transporter receptor subunit TctC